MKNDTLSAVSKAGFFHCLWSTDRGNVDNELLMVCWCDTCTKDEKIHTKIGFLAVDRPRTTNAEGLFKSLSHGLQQLGISDISKEACSHLIGISTYDAAVNIGSGGLKGLVEKQVPWIYVLDVVLGALA